MDNEELNRTSQELAHSRLQGTSQAGSVNNIDTTNDILELIPEEWRDAELRIGSSLDEPLPIIRVSLQTNKNGRRVVMLHEKQFRDEQNK